MTKLIPLSRAVAQASAVLGACLLAFACPASAYTPATKAGGESTPLNLSPTTSAAHTSSSGGASIVRTIVGLAIVIAVIWGLYWILRQVKAGRDPNVSSSGLASVAAITLSTGRSVHLIRAGSDYILVGSGEHGLVPIHRYTEEQAREAGLPLTDDIEAPRPRRSLLAGTGSARSAVREPYRWGTNPVVREPGAPGTSRHDPMSMPSPSSGLVERLRELTVRR
ncbi:MAG TPA: flagellar biosynthetic protein FliO [Solirubrobacteraceae bacterium]|nr:flagellar biosynthetic protein FliO [Solirubrobacteraceae bacterium]